MKYVHLLCLQQWVNSRTVINEDNSCISIFLNEYKCELCKSNFPFKYEINERKVKILNFKKPQKPYVIFELLDKDQNHNYEISIISFAKKNQITVGRSHDCDFRIEDISVSRSHSRLSFYENKLFIEDNGSKFGTIVKVVQPILLSERINMTFQVGRSVFKTRVRINKSRINSINGDNRFDSNLTLISNKRRSIEISNEEEEAKLPGEKDMEGSFDSKKVLRSNSKNNSGNELNSLSNLSYNFSNSKKAINSNRILNLFKKVDLNLGILPKKQQLDFLKPPNILGDMNEINIDNID